MRPIHLLPLTNRVTPEDVLAVRPDDDLIACDFYVEGIEHGEEVVAGYRQGRIINVDHHAPTPRMRRRTSSTNLALKWIESDPAALAQAAVVVLNHLDCDSVLCGGIMAGRLPPDRIFGEAALAADHTGEENEIADLLQGLDAEQSRTGVRDIEICFTNLRRSIDKSRLDDVAARALSARLRKRAEAEALVAGRRFQRVGLLEFAVLDSPTDGEFFPALLPGATVIMVANPLPSDPARWQVKLRLGNAAPEGFSLADLQIHEFDPAYGGRWNAGSNRRGGGVRLDPENYAAELARRVDAALPQIGAPG